MRPGPAPCTLLLLLTPLSPFPLSQEERERDPEEEGDEELMMMAGQGSKAPQGDGGYMVVEGTEQPCLLILKAITEQSNSEAIRPCSAAADPAVPLYV
jgi:hypothetical protein